MLSTIARCARGVLAKRPIAARLNPASMFDPFNRAPAIISPTFGVNSRGMANHRHKKVIKLAKGYFGRGNRCYRIAKQRVMKARQYAYRDRKVRRRNYRALWIMKINAAARQHGVSYNRFMFHLRQADIGLNRLSLSNLAVTEPLSFLSVVEIVKEKISAARAAYAAAPKSKQLALRKKPKRETERSQLREAYKAELKERRASSTAPW